MLYFAILGIYVVISRIGNRECIRVILSHFCVLDSCVLFTDCLLSKVESESPTLLQCCIGPHSVHIILEAAHQKMS